MTLKQNRCGPSTLSSTATPSRSRRLLLSRQPPPTPQPFALVYYCTDYRQLNRHRPVSRLRRLNYYVHYHSLNRHQPVIPPPFVNYYFDHHRLHLALLQLPATLLLRRWRPFVCRSASPRGPLTTASLLLLHRGLLPTSTTPHVRQRPFLQPPTLLTPTTSTHVLRRSLQGSSLLLHLLLLIRPCPSCCRLIPLPPRFQIRMPLTERCQGVTSSNVDDRRSSSWTKRPS